MGIRQKYAYKLLEKKANRLKRNVANFNFSKVKKVGILWHLSDIKGFNYCLNTLANQKFDLSSLCYREKSEEQVENSFGYKDLNWLGFPKTEIYKKFIETEFDLLLNISVINSFPLLVTTSLSRAKFKCGWTNQPNNYFDLMVDVSKNIDSKYLVEQQLYYLKYLTNNSNKDE